MLAASLLALAPDAAAQCEEEPTPSAAERRVARRHYRRGVRASQREQWQRARERFQRAYDTAPFAPIVYNLASTLEQLGDLVEAAEMFRAFLRRCEAAQNDRLRRDAEQLLASIEERISSVTIRVEGFDPERDQLLLDEGPLVAAVLGEELPISPGRHRVRVLRDESEEVAAGGFSVDAGSSWTLELSIGAEDPSAEGEGERAAGAVGDPGEGPPAAGGGFDPTPAWALFGAGLAVAAGGGLMLGIGQAEASAVENAEEGTPWVDVRDQAELADLLRNIGWITLGVGLGLATVGIVWALAGGGSDGDAEARIRLRPGGLSLEGRF